MVRIKFFQEPLLQNFRDQVYVYDDFPLEQDGSLDYSVVRKRWGLEKTAVRIQELQSFVLSVRYSPALEIIRQRHGVGFKTFEPSCPSRLNAREIGVMRGDDMCISVFGTSL